MALAKEDERHQLASLGGEGRGTPTYSLHREVALDRVRLYCHISVIVIVELNDLTSVSKQLSLNAIK